MFSKIMRSLGYVPFDALVQAEGDRMEMSATLAATAKANEELATANETLRARNIDLTYGLRQAQNRAASAAGGEHTALAVGNDLRKTIRELGSLGSSLIDPEFRPTLVVRGTKTLSLILEIPGYGEGVVLRTLINNKKNKAELDEAAKRANGLIAKRAIGSYTVETFKSAMHLKDAATAPPAPPAPVPNADPKGGGLLRNATHASSAPQAGSAPITDAPAKR